MYYTRFFDYNSFIFEAGSIYQIKKDLKDFGFKIKKDEYGYYHIINDCNRRVGLIEKYKP
jgi:hypothetical protein